MCCSPSQPSHHAGCPTRSRSRRECDGFLVTLASGHHRPDHPRNLVGKRDGSHLGGPPRQQCREPGTMFGAMDLGIADDGERPGLSEKRIVAPSQGALPRSIREQRMLRRDWLIYIMTSFSAKTRTKDDLHADARHCGKSVVC